MGREPIPLRKLVNRGLLWSRSFATRDFIAVLAPVSRRYSEHEGRLLTRYSPVRHFTSNPKTGFSFDLHVLGTPPAFVLSQDQTLQFNLTNHRGRSLLLAPSSRLIG